MPRQGSVINKNNVKTKPNVVSINNSDYSSPVLPVKHKGSVVSNLSDSIQEQMPNGIRKPPIPSLRKQGKNIGVPIELYNPLNHQIQLNEKRVHESKIPRLVGNNNVAYIGVSGEGAQQIGSLGINRTEKELIMRRYKAGGYNNNNLNRVYHHLYAPYYASQERGIIQNREGLNIH